MFVMHQFCIMIIWVTVSLVIVLILRTDGFVGNDGGKDTEVTCTADETWIGEKKLEAQGIVSNDGGEDTEVTCTADETWMGAQETRGSRHS